MKKLLFLPCLFLLYSCSEEKEPNSNSDKNDTAKVNLEKDSMRFTHDFTYQFSDLNETFWEYDADSKFRKELPSGSKVEIPTHAFIDKNGQPVENAQVKFEEFLSAGDIITSGIDMRYDSAGVSYDFESAGMFRITAQKEGVPVYIADGKSIKVELASMDNSSGFNAYYSNYDGSDWRYLTPSNPHPNKEKTTRLANLNESKDSIVPPVKPTPYKADGKYFDLNLSQQYSGDYKMLVGIVWQYSGDKAEEDPANNPDFYAQKWSYVNILPQDGKNGIYDITLKNDDTTANISAFPVYRGAILDEQNELFASELASFNQRMEQIKNQEKQATAEADFLRGIQVKQLGLYNYDRQLKYPNMVPLFADFDFGNDSLNAYPISAYLITGNGLAVVKYTAYTKEKFRYSPRDGNKILAILPNQEVVIFSQKRFPPEVPRKEQDFVFEMHATGMKADSPKKIDQILALY